MKYLLFTILVACSTACGTRNISELRPDHLGVTPSVEWEIMDGSCKTKPKIQTSLDWNF